jgi:hypothetical protein
MKILKNMLQHKILTRHLEPIVANKVSESQAIGNS